MRTRSTTTKGSIPPDSFTPHFCTQGVKQLTFICHGPILREQDPFAFSCQVKWGRDGKAKAEKRFCGENNKPQHRQGDEIVTTSSSRTTKKQTHRVSGFHVQFVWTISAYRLNFLRAMARLLSSPPLKPTSKQTQPPRSRKTTLPMCGAFHDEKNKGKRKQKNN